MLQACAPQQIDIATANGAATIWHLRKLNEQFANPKLKTEDDFREYGKGHEFATGPSRRRGISAAREKYLRSEIGARNDEETLAEVRRYVLPTMQKQSCGFRRCRSVVPI